MIQGRRIGRGFRGRIGGARRFRADLRASIASRMGESYDRSRRGGSERPGAGAAAMAVARSPAGRVRPLAAMIRRAFRTAGPRRSRLEQRHRQWRGVHGTKRCQRQQSRYDLSQCAGHSHRKDQSILSAKRKSSHLIGTRPRSGDLNQRTFSHSWTIFSGF